MNYLSHLYVCIMRPKINSRPSKERFHMAGETSKNGSAPTDENKVKSLATAAGSTGKWLAEIHILFDWGKHQVAQQIQKREAEQNNA
jgi:hypothetical protein